ncbi:growth-regulating factor 3 isoform X2 [Medicago truncatula]|uniref:Growth-regulating factor n=1 Tax=Medicago truncatula TaxID=3880 RepID=A0A072U430_MEDTR|nr:growth-regulating factor 3 isoform X2 [Medicago truncatula]KEH24126.1 growth-regulating factor [Medicago truncatula]
MDFPTKQWRNQQHESEKQHSTKMPKLLHPAQSQSQSHSHQQSPALPLFLPQPNTKVTNLSDSALPSNNRFPRIGMGSHFSLSQWQELELQALIFRYMLVGASVPPELLQPIKKSLLHSSPYFLHHYQPTALLQSGYWGRGAMDPEPGRCRRTDGKKWRCARDVVAGQKYCERHMHRGRNRSRKPVELPTPTSNGGGSFSALSSISSQPLVTSSFKSPFDLHFTERSTGTKIEEKSLCESDDHVGGDGRPGGQMLRHFFDDWPRSLQDSDNAENNDVSLKLSTGYGEEPCPRNENVGLVQTEQQQQQLQLNWIGGWNSGNQVSSMGGPLAEALRSSTSTSSPTSVLHQLPRCSGSQTSYIST